MTRTRTQNGARMLMAAAVVCSVTVGMLAPATATQKSVIDIMLTSRPSPQKIGDNTFEVMLKSADGKPMWEATVMVTRGGKEVASKKFPVTAK